MPPSASADHTHTGEPELSAALQALSAVVGQAGALEEGPVEDESGSPSPVSRRRFQFRPARVVRGDPGLLTAADCAFEGLTIVPLDAARLDPQFPTLFLDGQRFFDEPHPPGPIPILVLIGDPAPPASMGFGGRTSRVVGGELDGLGVRPFRLTGADRNLADVMPSLVGWQGQSDAAMQAAVVAQHPLIPLDALRIAARGTFSIDTVEALAMVLLHPTQAPQAKVLALGVLRTVISRLPPGSPDAERLLRVTAWNWRLERSQPIEAAYLETWLGAVDQLLASVLGTELRALATDTTGGDRVARLRAELARLLSSMGRRNA